MSHSLIGAGRTTHLKILCVALRCARSPSWRSAPRRGSRRASGPRWSRPASPRRSRRARRRRFADEEARDRPAEAGPRRMTDMTTATADTQDFTISRTFEAPRARVWKAWTEPGGARHNGGARRVRRSASSSSISVPAACSTTRWHFSPATTSTAASSIARSPRPNGWCGVSAFSDAEGGIADAPFPQLAGQVAARGAERHDAHRAGRQDDAHRCAAARSMRPRKRARCSPACTNSMRGGFGGTFEKLDAYLAQG